MPSYTCILKQLIESCHLIQGAPGPAGEKGMTGEKGMSGDLVISIFGFY